MMVSQFLNPQRNRGKQGRSKWIKLTLGVFWTGLLEANQVCVELEGVFSTQKDLDNLLMWSG